MFGIGMPELIIILVVALIVIGPKKLPELAKSLGRALNEFKKATQDITDTIDITRNVYTVDKPTAGRISHDETVQPITPDTAKSASEKSGPDEQTPSGTPEIPETGETSSIEDENVKDGQKIKDDAPEAGGLDE